MCIVGHMNVADTEEHPHLPAITCELPIDYPSTLIRVRSVGMREYDTTDEDDGDERGAAADACSHTLVFFVDAAGYERLLAGCRRRLLIALRARCVLVDDGSVTLEALVDDWMCAAGAARYESAAVDAFSEQPDEPVLKQIKIAV